MIKKIYVKRIVFSLVLLIVLPIAIVYMWSTVILDKSYNIPLSGVHIPNDTASIREGERLARIAHCAHCHGDHFSGGVVSKTDYIAQFVAPNITKIIPGYSNEELERLLRHGVKKNGQSVYSMPSDMYYQLKEESINKIIAYLRSLPPVPSTANIPALTTYYLLGRLRLIQGKITPVADIINHNAPRQFAQYDTSLVTFGKYLTTTACTSCHGKELKGKKGFSPDLIIATAYTKDQFIHLLHAGEGLSRKNLGMMSDIAKNHLSYLHDNEMNAIYAYLKTSPSKMN
jgi:cytochrome c553